MSKILQSKTVFLRYLTVNNTSPLDFTSEIHVNFPCNKLTAQAQVCFADETTPADFNRVWLLNSDLVGNRDLVWANTLQPADPVTHYFPPTTFNGFYSFQLADINSATNARAVAISPASGGIISVTLTFEQVV